MIKRKRNLEEAVKLARSEFKNKVVEFLSAEGIDEITDFGIVEVGSITEDWKDVLGFEPRRDKFYEVEIYKSSAETPFAEKISAKILVSRNYASQKVGIIRRPKV